MNENNDKTPDEKDLGSKVIKSTINEELKNEIEHLAKSQNTSTSKLTAKLLDLGIQVNKSQTDAAEPLEQPRQGAKAKNIESDTSQQYSELDVVKDQLNSYTALINRNSKEFSEGLSETNESLKKTSVNFNNSIKLNTVSLINSIEAAEQIIDEGCKTWKDLLQKTESFRTTLDEANTALLEYKNQRDEYKYEIKWFKKSLITETHEYRKKLDRFAVKHYTWGICFMGISTAGLYFALRFMP